MNTSTTYRSPGPRRTPVLVLLVLTLTLVPDAWPQKWGRQTPPNAAGELLLQAEHLKVHKLLAYQASLISNKPPKDWCYTADDGSKAASVSMVYDVGPDYRIVWDDAHSKFFSETLLPAIERQCSPLKQVQLYNHIAGIKILNPGWEDIPAEQSIPDSHYETPLSQFLVWVKPDRSFEANRFMGDYHKTLAELRAFSEDYRRKTEQHHADLEAHEQALKEAADRHWETTTKNTLPGVDGSLPKDIASSLPTGAHQKIPDTRMTRQYVISWWAKINERCGEGSEGSLALKALYFGSDDAKDLMDGMSHPGSGILQGWASVMQRWNDSGLTPMRHVQGERDAAEFLGKHSCTSPEGAKARRSVEALIIARHQDSPSDSSFTSAELMAACLKAIPKGDFCSCAAPTVRRYATPAEVNAFAADFGKSLRYIHQHLLWRIKEPINRCYKD